MALVSTEHQKLRKTLSIERRPLMLKDYLRDDLSSCSSSGFKSFPRRQCCTTVRFLLEIDLKTKQCHKHYNSTKKQLLQRSRSKAASKTISVLHRASEALLNAVKQLPFPSVKSQSPSAQRSPKKALLPRSISRKLLKRGFWRKADREELTNKRWKTFREYLQEQHQPSDHLPATTLTPNRVSTSSSSKSNSISNSWVESDFTAEILQSSSGNSEISSENDAGESKKDEQSSQKKLVSDRVGVSVGEDSITGNTKHWRSEEEKEQFSPVSVLDCPFEDEKDTNSPPFEHRLARMEGTKQKLMQKLRRFESLAQLEPLDLEKRIASLEVHDECPEISSETCSKSALNNKASNEDEETETETETEKKAKALLKIVKSTAATTKFMCKAENLISDFFRERMAENNEKRGVDVEQRLLREAEDWINGESQNLLLGWEVKDGRKAYVKDMDKCGRWRNDAEKVEVGLTLELEIFTSLVNELLLDLLY